MATLHDFARPGRTTSSRGGVLEHAMQIRVETYVDEDGVEKLRRFRFDSREIEVAENIDQWHGAEYRYFKVRASDGGIYILRFNDVRADWELTMYQRSR
jgi:hypothetical protein